MLPIALHQEYLKKKIKMLLLILKQQQLHPSSNYLLVAVKPNVHHTVHLQHSISGPTCSKGNYTG